MALEGVQGIYQRCLRVLHEGAATVYTTQQGVRGIYCAASAVLALWLWVLLVYYRRNFHLWLLRLQSTLTLANPG